VEHSWYELFETNWDGRFSESMYQCEDEVPPERMTSSVEWMCEIECTLENCMPVSRLKNHWTPDNKKMKCLYYNVRMIPSGRSVDFDVEVNKTRLGKKNVDIKFLTGSTA
jgi:hypothetical protein